MELSKAVVLFCVIALVKCACKNKERHLYYKELQCKPIFTSDPDCASSYDCSHIAERKDNKCYYKGLEYNEGAILESTVFTDSPCTVECRCLSNYKNQTEFTCVTSECPDLFGPPLEEGCVHTFSSVNQCCSESKYCKNEKAVPTKCSYNGEEFVEGQKFYPDDEPCKECICGSGFNGTLSEPWCRTISCKYDLFYADRLAEGCMPLLYKELSCCPIGWKCPSEGTYNVIPSPDTKTSEPSKPNEQCTFGNLKLNIGDQVTSQEDDDSVCTCVIPPHLFCVNKQ